LADGSGKWSLFPGIFIISLSSLAFEISLTRIFSIAYGSHFAYLVISIALLGYGAAGAFLKLFHTLIENKADKLILAGSVLFTASILISYLTVNAIPFEPYEIVWDRKQMIFLPAVFITLSVPFFFSGITVLSAIYHKSNEAGKIYFSDLTGAGAGCFIPLLYFSLLGGSAVVPAIAAVSLLSSFFFGVYTRSKLKFLLPLLMLLAVSLPFIMPGYFDIRISPYRDLKRALGYEGARITWTVWDAVSRTDVIESPAVRFAPGLSIKYMDELPRQTGITVDGGSLQALTDMEPSRMGFIEHLPSSLPYILRSPENVFIYGFGGGLDIISAKHYGAKMIDATEKNPATADIFMEHYKGIFDFDTIRIIKTEGRNYIRASDAVYDHVIISLSETLGASAGVYTFGEDYRFTVEAFREYYDKLKDGGLISVTRYLRPILIQDEKLLRMMIESLPDEADAPMSLMSIRSLGTITTLIKKGDITLNEISLMKEFCTENRFDIVYYPGMSADEANLYNRFPAPLYFELYDSILKSGAVLYGSKPVTDDAPFFNWISSYREMRWAHWAWICL